ncbi:MAG: sugar-transfer associated ATP-grasp domain-containing protein [Pseudomonadota bacterium]
MSQGIPVQDYYSGGLATLSKLQQEQFVPFWMYRDAVLFCMPVEQTHEDVVRINSKSKLAAQVKAEGYSAPKTLALFDPADDDDQPPIQRSFFAKPDLGGMGIHAQRWLLRDRVFFQEEDNQAIPENEISSHLKEKCRGIGKTLLVQELMENSTTIRAWAGNTLATARIDTCRTPDGDITIGRAILRMPSATTSSVDNLHSGGTGFHIDPISGTIGMGNSLDGFGPADYSRTSPATGETVTGHTVPDWAEMVAMVKHLHANLSDLPIIGWDVGHTTGGPTVVEANVPAGIGVTVLYKMGGFFASPLGECLTKCIEARLKETQPEGSRLRVGAEHTDDRYNGE